MLYEYGLEQNILSPNESLDTRTFLNIVSVFSKLASSERTIQIIEKFSDKVDYCDSSSIKQLASSTLDFYLGKHKKVLRDLRTIETHGFDLKFKTRWIMLKSLIEIDHSSRNVILTQLHNFKRNINSNRGQINQPTYYGLITTLSILSKIIKRMPKEEIRNYIIESNSVFEKKWVIQLLNRIEY